MAIWLHTKKFFISKKGVENVLNTLNIPQIDGNTRGVKQVGDVIKCKGMTKMQKKKGDIILLWELKIYIEE